MNRRQFLELLIAGGVGLTLDPDRLLWVPNQKKIFIPSGKILTESQIIAAEWNRILPHVRHLFERDDTFYHMLDDGSEISANRPFIIPLQITDKRRVK